MAPAVWPSTAPDEYDNPTCGDNPPGTGGTPIGYDHEKSAPDPPACHEYDDENGVCVKSPVSDDEPAVNAYTTPPPDPDPTAGAATPHRDGDNEPATTGALTDNNPAADTCALTLDPRTSLTDPTGEDTKHPATPGVLTTHPGKLTNRNRCDQSAPNNPANDE